MQPIPEHHPLKHLFSGLVEHAFFTELGVCDPALVDYVSDLLIDFVHVDHMTQIRNLEGRPLGEITEVLGTLEVEQDLPERLRDRLIHRRVGDYTLFWAGVYPEGITRRGSLPQHDFLQDYVRFGKRSYAIASALTHPDELPPPNLLQRLSSDFEFCAYGLGIVRRGLEHQPPPDGQSLIY